MAKHKQKSKDIALTSSEYKILKEKLQNDKHRIILILGARAGLRVSEIIQCRYTWIKKNKIGGSEVLEIEVPNSDRDINNSKKIWKQKNTGKVGEKKDKTRTTYLFNSDEINEIYFWFKNNPKGLGITRQHITTNIVRNNWSKVIKRDYEKTLTCHSLRAAAQNYLYYEKKIDVNVISIMLGHEDSRTTLNFYNSKTKASAESYLESFLSKGL